MDKQKQRKFGDPNIFASWQKARSINEVSLKYNRHLKEWSGL